MSGLIGCGLLLVFGVAVGLVVYETLMRYAVAKNKTAAVVREPKSERPLRRFSAQGNPRHHSLGALLTTITNALERFAPLARSEANACRDRLERAGSSLSPGTWRSLRVVSGALGGFMAAALVAGFGSLPLLIRFILFCVGVCAGWAMPSLLLSNRIQRRRLAIEARLPDAMELLGIAIAAGSPVEQCFREVAASLEGPLSDEFALVDQEVNLLGHAREAALENLGKRCGSSEVGAFVAQLTQAVSQGTSIAETLANQAKLSRDMMQADALERIRKMPTKLDVVLSLCFLPPTVALVVIPTVVKLLQFLNDTMA